MLKIAAPTDVNHWKQDATLSQGQPRDAPYIGLMSVLTPILPLTLSLSITYNNRHVSHLLRTAGNDKVTFPCSP